jgi:cytochrome P450
VYITDEAVRQMVLPGWWLCRRPQGDGVEEARKVIDDYLEECIADRRRLAQSHKPSSSDNDSKTTTDLLNILLEAEANGVMGHNEVKGQLLQFVFAGFDTLAPTLTYMLWEVSSSV